MKKLFLIAALLVIMPVRASAYSISVEYFNNGGSDIYANIVDERHNVIFYEEFGVVEMSDYNDGSGMTKAEGTITLTADPGDDPTKAVGVRVTKKYDYFQNMKLENLYSVDYEFIPPDLPAPLVNEQCMLPNTSIQFDWDTLIIWGEFTLLSDLVPVNQGTARMTFSSGYHTQVLAQVVEGNCSNPVPEPTTMLLFGAGLAGLVGVRMRKKK